MNRRVAEPLRDAVGPIAVALALVGCGPNAVAPGAGTSGAESTGGDAPSTGTDEPGDPPIDATTAADADASTADGSTPIDAGVRTACGDGDLDADESCDDGNLEIGDGCNADCVPGGQLVWERALDRAEGDGDLGFGIAIDPADRPWIVGSSGDAGWLVRLEPDGAIAAELTEGGASLPTEFTAVAIAPDARVIVAGSQAGHASVWCYSAEQELLWSYVDPGTQTAVNGLVLDPTGAILVSSHGAPPYDIVITRLDADGQRAWMRSPGARSIWPGVGMSIDSAGAIVLGWGDGERVVLRKFSSELDELWSSVLEVDAVIFDIAMDASDDPVAGGLTLSPSWRSRVAHHSGIDGALQWEREFSGDPEAVVVTMGLAIDHAGRPIAAGLHLPSNSGTTSGAFVRKYDADGDDVWSYETPSVEDGGEVANDVAIDGTEHVYVVGNRTRPGVDTEVWVAKLTP